MSKIIKPNKPPQGKDCCDWTPLRDGTKTGDTKYCDLSQLCRQIGMKTDWYEFYDHENNKFDFDYFCTGCLVNEENKRDDDEVS